MRSANTSNYESVQIYTSLLAMYCKVLVIHLWQGGKVEFTAIIASLQEA